MPNHRGALDLDTIVQVAIAIADAEGIERVSMRTVAARIDVPVMSIYRHVRNKQELIHGMVEAALSEQSGAEQPGPSVERTASPAERTPPPARRPDTSPSDASPPEGAGSDGSTPVRSAPEVSTGWRAVLEREGRREWAIYRRHPWMLHVLASSRPPLGRSVLDSIDRTVRALLDAGVEDDAAIWVYLLLSGYVQGAALLLVSEHDALRDTGLSRAVWWSRQRAPKASPLADVVRYPWLAQPLPKGSGPEILTHLEEWFEFGLQRVLDGIADYVDGAE